MAEDISSFTDASTAVSAHVHTTVSSANIQAQPSVTAVHENIPQHIIYRFVHKSQRQYLYFPKTKPSISKPLCLKCNQMLHIYYG